MAIDTIAVPLEIFLSESSQIKISRKETTKN